MTHIYPVGHLANEFEFLPDEIHKFVDILTPVIIGKVVPRRVLFHPFLEEILPCQHD